MAIEVKTTVLVDTDEYGGDEDRAKQSVIESLLVVPGLELITLTEERQFRPAT